MKTIFLAESEKHVLDALRLLVEQQTGMKVVGEARSAEALLVQVCQQEPDAILLDWNLPGFHPQRFIQALRDCCPSTKLLAISVRPEHAESAREYGLDGFLSKQLSAESFAALLNSILLSSSIKKENL